MKSKIRTAIIVSAFCILHSAFGQGSLMPPGPPGPTMLTLSQVEPRTPISSAPFIITQPGSYYLASNILVTSGNAITVATNGVTLDLHSFTISSTAASAAGYGILLNSGLQNITILNGYIQGGVTNNGFGAYGGSGFAYGLAYSGTAPVNARVAGISVSGCLDYGIYLGGGNSTIVDSCTVQNVGSYGIVASTITKCVAWLCGNTAIAGDQVSDCRGAGGSGGNGISATVAQNSQGQGGSAGIAANSALNCYGYSFNGPGLSVSTAENCYGHSFNNDGIDATTVLNSYGNGGNDGINASQNALNCTGAAIGSGSGVSAGGSAESCYGSSASGTGVYSGYSAQNSAGSSSVGIGLEASIAENCTGISQGGTGHGVSAYSVNNCYGSSDGGFGLYTTCVQNSYGYSTTNYAIYAVSANNCYGYSTYSDGIHSYMASGSYGQSEDVGYGIFVQTIATACFGYSISGTGLRANIAESCSGTSLNVTHNLNSY